MKTLLKNINRRKVFLLLFAIQVFQSNVFATTYTMGTSGAQSATITATSGAPDKFYDNGGSGSNYGDGITSVTYTFNCAGGKYVRLKMNSCTTESGYDYFYVYDGATTSDRLLGLTARSGTLTSCMYVSSSGSLTVKFTSDGSVNDVGWDIDVWIDDYPGQLWDGSSSTEVSTAANWEGSVLPYNDFSSIYIPSGLSNYPTLSNSSSPLEVFDLNVANGATFTYSSTASGHGLFVYGNIDVDGTFNHSGNYFVQCEGGTSGSYATIGGSGTYSNIRIEVGYNLLAYYKLANSSTFFDFSLQNDIGNSIFDMNTYNLTTYYYAIESSTTFYQRTGTLSMEEDTPTIVDASFNEATGTTAFSSGTNWTSVSQTVPAITYYNLSTSGTGTKTLSGTTVVSGALSVGASTTLSVNTRIITMTGTSTIAGTMTISTGTVDANNTFDATGGAVTFSGTGYLNLGGAVTSLGTFTESTSTVAYDYAGAQTVDADDYFNLTFSNAGTKTSAGTTTVGNSLTVNSTATYAVAATSVTVAGTTAVQGTLTISTGTLDADWTFDATGGAVTFTGSGNLYLGSTVTSIGTFTESTSTVTYDDAGAQTIVSDTYYNLSTGGSGAKTLEGAIVVNGNVNLSGGVLTQSTYAINVAGNWTSSGNYFTEGTGTVTFDGTGVSTISATTATVASSSTIYSDDCESSTGWTLDGGTANWVLTTPTGTYSPTNDNSASGTKCFKTAAAGSTYGSTKTYILTSPTIDLTGYTGTSLSFYLWMNNEGTTSLYDGGFIEVYNGTSWVSATGSVAYDGAISSSFSNPYAATSAWTYDRTTWTQITVDISAYDGISNFKIRFKYGSDSSSEDGGWAVDDLTVTGNTSTTFTGEAFKKFAINKTGGGYVQLSSNMWAETHFTLTSGVLRTGAYTLTLGLVGTNVTLSGGSSSAYVAAYDNSGTIGYVKHFVNSNAAYVYPIGDLSNYTPLTFTLSAGTLASAYLTVYTKDVKVPGLNSAITAYLDRYWNVSESGFTTPTYDISYTYVDADLVGSETGMLPIKKSGSTWYKPTGSSFTDGTAQGTGSFVAGTNTLTWTGLSTFSGFGGVPDGVVALPIAMVSFEGKKDMENNILTWQTSTELNNDFFTIEKTYDGENYEIVGTEDGAGNSNQYLQYTLTDYDVRKVINYYRLKQTDFDGKYTFSNVIAIDNRVNIPNKEVALITNILGQEVNEFYRGVVIIVYSDGTSVKVIQ